MEEGGCAGSIWDIISGSADAYLEKGLAHLPTNTEAGRLTSSPTPKRRANPGRIPGGLPALSHGIKLGTTSPTVLSPKGAPVPATGLSDKRPTRSDTGSKETFSRNIDDHKGDIKNMAMNQSSCRYLQKQISTKDTKIIQTIFSEVIEDIVMLINHPFGNYLCQQLIDKGSTKQRSQIIAKAYPYMAEMSCNIYGSRPVQKIIENLGARSEDIQTVTRSLSGSIVALIQDINGNHVVQKCIRCLSPRDNQFIYDVFSENCTEVATHRFGCCVMQAALDHGTKAQQEQLIKVVEENCVLLTRDPFGNYVVQHILDMGREDIPFRIVKNLQGQIHSLSLLKFSSNVIDKCIKLGSSDCAIFVMRELLELDEHQPDPEAKLSTRLQERIVEQALDCYGNYIIQACLSDGKTKAPQEYKLLISLLEPSLHQLKGTACGSKLSDALGRVVTPPSSPGRVRTTRRLVGPSEISENNEVTTWTDVSPGALVVDVREVTEFSTDAHPGAVNIPMGEFIRECTQPVPSDKFSAIRTADKVFIYCADGTRAQLVVSFAKNVGLSNLFKIEGGLSSKQ